MTVQRYWRVLPVLVRFRSSRGLCAANAPVAPPFQRQRRRRKGEGFGRMRSLLIGELVSPAVCGVT